MEEESNKVSNQYSMLQSNLTLFACIPQFQEGYHLYTAALVSVSLLPDPPSEDHSSLHHGLPMGRGRDKGGEEWGGEQEGGGGRAEG